MARGFLSGGLAGARELDEALKAIGRTTSRTVLRTALRRAGKPVLEEARQLAPVGDGDDAGRLRDSLAMKATLSKRQARLAGKRPGEVVLYIGPTDPKGHLVEFGHDVVRGSKDGKRRVVGHAAAVPFLRPAWDRHGASVADRLGEEIWKAIRRTANRWARQSDAGRLSRSGMRAIRGGRVTIEEIRAIGEG